MKFAIAFSVATIAALLQAGCDAFVGQLAAQRTVSTSGQMSATTAPRGSIHASFLKRQGIHHVAHQHQQRHGSNSQLAMALEEFLDGRDDAQRDRENKSYLDDIQKRVETINNLEPVIEELGDDELQEKTAEFKKRLAGGEDINGKILEEAFAVVREAAWRVLELRHYDVQLLGGLILHDGRLAEMATGEGKTLVATLPTYVNALTGDSSFVVTVNDYLAKRDMEIMGQVHRFLGLTVGLIQSGMTEDERREQYACDVVYVTNSELGFDYLRDHLALSQAQTVLPGGANEFNGFCVVDEADSVLIDEARTPLIISKQVPAPSYRYDNAYKLAEALKADIHYTVDLKNKVCTLNEVGYRDCERALGVDSLFELDSDGASWAPFIINAINGKELFNKDIEYTVLFDDDGNKSGVGIIDAFTGRVLDGRRWSDGLHQSIETREGIQVSEQSQVIAKVTYQALFRQFTRLSGMTGTAKSDAAELEVTYGLKVTPVPTALPIARRDYPDVAFKTRKAADDALIKEIVAAGGGKPDGRPCLVGTTSVAQSEKLVALLEENGIHAELLNASPKNAPRESEIVAQAGRAGSVTVATNMAGRGTDILLGGCPRTMARLKTRSYLVEEAGVLSDEEADKLPPSPPADYYPCEVDDDIKLALKVAASSLKKAVGDDLTAVGLDEILSIAIDTTEAEDDPAHIVSLRDVTEAIKTSFAEVTGAEKEYVLKSGGLYVMGTNRHESRRIDQQLRGRSGRQGDPGTSRFFLSFEDDVFVIFGGDSLNKILKMFRVSDDMPVEAPQVSEALDKVQKTVEDKYREIRGEIFKFDEVLNGQRRVLYEKRQAMLFSSAEESLVLMREYNGETISSIVDAQVDEETKAVNVDKVVEKIGQFFPLVGSVIRAGDIAGKDADAVKQFLTLAVDEVFNSRVEDIEKEAVAAGRPPASLGRSSNYITLVSMDNAWSDHLQAMENLKEVVVLRQIQGRDPLREYEDESYRLFSSLLSTIRNNAVFSLWQSLGQSLQATA